MSALVCPVMVAVTVTGWFAAGAVGVAVTAVMRGPRPVRRTELAAPGVRPAALVAAAQFEGVVVLEGGVDQLEGGPVPSALTGHGSTSR